MRRVLREVGPGQYMQEPELQDMDGKAVRAPITDRRILTQADLPAPVSQFFIHPQQSTNMTTPQNYPAGMAPVIGVAETATGSEVAFRNEASVGVGRSSVRRPLRFTITSTAAAATVVYLGDGTGLVRAKDKNFGAGIPAGVTIGGTYGVNTHALFQELTKSATLDLHGLHIAGYDDNNAEDPTVFDEGQVTLQSVSPDFQNLSEVVLPLSDLLGSGDFRSNIREDSSFRFKAGALSAIRIDMPAGSKMVLTFRKIVSVGLPGHFFKTELF